MLGEGMQQEKSYRELVEEVWGKDAARVAGCALDRVGGFIPGAIQDQAVWYWKDNKEKFKPHTIDTRRNMVAEFVRTGIKAPGFK